MSKLKCPCGYTHDLSPIPDKGWITTRDADYEQVIEAECRINEISKDGGLPGKDDPRGDEYDQSMRVIVGKHGSMYECPECGRLMWELPGKDNFKVFLPEK